MSNFEFIDKPTNIGVTGFIGGVKILGFDVQVRNGSSVWLTLQEGVNVLYGKNGSGKTSVLDALRNFCSETEDFLWGQEVHMYIEVDQVLQKTLTAAAYLDLFEPLLKCFDSITPQQNVHLPDVTLRGSPLPNEGYTRDSQLSPQESYKYLLGSSNLEIDSVRQALEKKSNQLDVETTIALSELTTTFQAALSTTFSTEKVGQFDVLADLFIRMLENKSNPITEVYNHGGPDWYVSYIKHSLASALFHGEPIEPLTSICEWGREWNPVSYGGELLLSDGFRLDGATFGELTSHDSGELFSELFTYFAESNRRFISGTINESYRDTFLKDFREICFSGVLRVSKVGPSDWRISPAVRATSLPKSLIDGELLKNLQNRYFSAWIDSGQSANNEIYWFRFGDGSDENWQPSLKHLPFVLLDLDAELDLSTFFADMKPAQFGLDEIDDEFFAVFQAELDRVCEDISLNFTHLEVAIEQVRAKISRRVKDWISGRPVKVEYLDCNVRQWIPISQGSSAQQRSIGLAVRLFQASQYRAPVLLVADEPDQGLHISATQSISRVLREIGQTSLISSHSPGVIRDPFVHLLHLHRGVLGEFCLENLEISDDPLASSLSLGIDTVDLLPRLRVAVFVEGEHDLVAVEELLKWQESNSGDPRIRQFTKIIASRGVGQMTNSVDAQLLLDYTDAHLLIIADNFRTERFEPLLKNLQNGQRKGLADWELLELLGKKHLESPNPRNKQSGTTLEERTMFDVLKVAIRNRSLDRLSIIGIGAPDITELFPSSSFGLKDSWDQLRADFNKDRNLPNVLKSFKDWLRISRNADITARSIAREVRKSCVSTEGPPPALVEVGSAIASLATRE